jgi:hypothetical protein
VRDATTKGDPHGMRRTCTKVNMMFEREAGKATKGLGGARSPQPTANSQEPRARSIVEEGRKEGGGRVGGKGRQGFGLVFLIDALLSASCGTQSMRFNMWSCGCGSTWL